MYEVNLINDDITLINSSTITYGAPRLLAGKVNLGINTIDSFLIFSSIYYKSIMFVISLLYRHIT